MWWNKYRLYDDYKNKWMTIISIIPPVDYLIHLTSTPQKQGESRHKAFYLIWCFNCGSHVEHKTKSWGCSVEIIKYCHMNDNRGKQNYIQLRLNTSASFNQEDTIKPITVESSKREALHSDILYTYSTLVIWDKDGTTARGQCRHPSYNLIKLVTYDQIF